MKRLKKEYRSHVETKVSESESKTKHELSQLQEDMSSLRKDVCDIRLRLKSRIEDLEKLVDLRVPTDTFDKKTQLLSQASEMFTNKKVIDLNKELATMKHRIEQTLEEHQRQITELAAYRSAELEEKKTTGV